MLNHDKQSEFRIIDHVQRYGEQIYIYKCLNLHFSYIPYAIYNWYIPTLFFIVLKFEHNIAKNMLLLVLIDCLHRKMTSQRITFCKQGKGGGVSVNKCQTFHFTLNAAYYLEVYFNSWKNPHGSLKWNVSFITEHCFSYCTAIFKQPPPPSCSYIPLIQLYSL